MTMIVPSALAAALVWSNKATNPIKTSVAILLVGGSMMQISSSITGTSWITLLILMLFMGGIIMMFMMLSSVLPNEKSMKTKNTTAYLLVVVLLIATTSLVSGAPKGSLTKTFLSSGQNFYFMMGLILMFFLGSMSTLSTEGNPMRTIYCH